MPLGKASGAPKKTLRKNEGCDDSKTWKQRHETTDNVLKNNFSSVEVFPRPRNLSIDFVPDLTRYICPLEFYTIC